MIKLASLFLLLMLSTFSAHAGKDIGFLYSYGGEKIFKQIELPDTEYYQYENTYVDIGYITKQFSVFMIPLWNYDGRWIGYINSDSDFLELPMSQLQDIARTAGTTTPKKPSLPFWDAYGGKAVGIVILLLFVGYVARPKT